MQRFVAELSIPIEKIAFEKSWDSDLTVDHTQPKVEFAFTGKRVSVIIHSETATQWPAVNFRGSFSAAVRRLDNACNIRWI